MVTIGTDLALFLALNFHPLEALKMGGAGGKFFFFCFEFILRYIGKFFVSFSIFFFFFFFLVIFWGGGRRRRRRRMRKGGRKGRREEGRRIGIII